MFLLIFILFGQTTANIMENCGVLVYRNDNETLLSTQNGVNFVSIRNQNNGLSYLYFLSGGLSLKRVYNHQNLSEHPNQDNMVKSFQDINFYPTRRYGNELVNIVYLNSSLFLNLFPENFEVVWDFNFLAGIRKRYNFLKCRLSTYL